tara:strand:- start:60 stop:722 length:663 start_codon:yes stop_codon:yes gene_type:complete
MTTTTTTSIFHIPAEQFKAQILAMYEDVPGGIDTDEDIIKAIEMDINEEHEIVGELTCENDELKEEIQRIKQEKRDLMIHYTKSDENWEETSWTDFVAEVTDDSDNQRRQRECLEELKAGNESMKKTLQDKFNEIEELKSCLEYDPEEAEIVSKDYIKRLQAENERLTAENEQLNDDGWVIDHHKALKYKIIIDEERYIDFDEHEALKEELEELKARFFR